MNLRRAALPLWMAIATVLWLIAIFVFANADRQFPSAARYLIMAVPFAAWAIGLFAAWRSLAARKLKLTYTLAAALHLLATISLLVWQEPTTINVFGAAGVLIGSILGVGAGFLMFRAALKAAAQPVHSCWT